MAYLTADPCIKCKYTDCVAVCPVDCFYEGQNFLVINPEECIDCGACEPECPTAAIFEEQALPAKWEAFLSINSVFSGAVRPEDASMVGWPEHLRNAANAPGFRPWPNIALPQEALPDADAYAETADKLSDISPDGATVPPFPESTSPAAST